MKRAAAVLLALAATAVCAHELQHSVQVGPAVVVELRYADGGPFSYEVAELYRPGEAAPFLTGRTDANGRVAFVPDQGGDWRLRVFSEDGHGGDFTFQAGPDPVPVAADAPLGTPTKLALGLSLLFGVFGAWALLLRRSR